MTSIITTPNAGVVLTAADVRQQCRIDLTDEDAWLEGIAIPAVVKLLEIETRCKPLTTSVRQYASAWPAAALDLDWGVVIDVVDVRYLDTTGTEQLLASSAYELVPVTAGVKAIFFVADTLPDLSTTKPNPVRINYRVGFGNDASAVPKDVKAWMLAHVGHFYNNREAFTEADLKPLPFLQNIIADLVRQPI